MSCDRILPFPRGRTACDGAMTPTSDCFAQFVGQEYKADDTVHGTNKDLTLVALRVNTAITVAKKFFMFHTGALDFGAEISGVNSVAGGPCVALDDAYTVGDTIAQYDVAWFVVDGPVSVLTELSSVSLTAQGLVTSDATGYVDGAAPAAGNYCVGRIDQTSTTTNAAVVVHVSRGFAGGEGT